MNILIVAPQYTPHVGDYYAFPLGISYVSAALKAGGFPVICLNLSHFDSVEDALTKCITENNIDILCTGGLSTDYKRIEDILKCARTLKPGLITILGGGIVSSDPEPILKLLNVDYGVIGEGEVTAVELMNYVTGGGDVKNIKGVIYRSPTGEIIRNAPRDSIDDLDSIPFPDLEGFGASQYLSYQMSNDMYDLSSFDEPRYLPIISSRSCPYSCTFCFHPLGTKYRQRSFANFFKELDQLIGKYKINYAGVYDELFSNDKKRIVEFCSEMKKRNIRWMTQLRVDKVDEEMLGLLKESGLFFVSYGIESADEKVLKSMKKNITVTQIERALELTCKMNIGTQGNLIFGDTDETWESAMTSLRWFKKHKEYNLGLIPISAYPGTPMYWKAIESGRIKDREAFLKDPGNRNISKMSDKQYEKLMQELWNVSAKTYVQLRGKILKMDLIDTDPVKGNIYLLETRCPFCHNHNVFPRFNIRGIDRFMGLLIHCKRCYRQHAVYDSVVFVRLMFCLPSSWRHKILTSRTTLSTIKKFFARLCSWRATTVNPGEALS